MAMPIRRTPVLKGKDAENFLAELKKEENKPSLKRVKFIKSSIKNEKIFNRWLSEANV